MKDKIIFHLDLNYFFCRCEEIINPALEKIPFVVGAINKRSVISASNKTAREFGVRAAMKFSEAIQLCPKLITVDLHMQLYAKKSQEFFDCIRKYFSTQIEVMSIDECFLDVTNMLSNYHDNYEILAYQIIKTIKEKTNLYVTVGIGNNKFLAKMAGDMKPTNGIATIFIDEIKEKLWPMEIEKVYMIGKVSCKLLQSLGIYKIIDFIKYDDHTTLEQQLKSKRYHTIMNNCLGGADEPINYHSSISKSISCANTFIVNTNDINEIHIQLNYLINSVYQDLIDANLLCQTFSVTIKYDYTNHVSKSFTRKQYTDDQSIIKSTLIKLFNHLWDEDQEIRGLSVGLNKIIAKSTLKNQMEFKF